MPSEMGWLEFKEAKNDFGLNDLGKYFSAISNEANLKDQHSSWIIFGVKDKSPWDIAGTRYREE
ncbi:MAG: ATP-binding protein, partial [Chlamydiota bacterium]